MDAQIIQDPSKQCTTPLTTHKYTRNLDHHSRSFVICNKNNKLVVEKLLQHFTTHRGGAKVSHKSSSHINVCIFVVCLNVFYRGYAPWTIYVGKEAAAAAPPRRRNICAKKKRTEIRTNYYKYSHLRSCVTKRTRARTAEMFLFARLRYPFTILYICNISKYIHIVIGACLGYWCVYAYNARTNKKICRPLNTQTTKKKLYKCQQGLIWKAKDVCELFWFL